MEPDPLIAPSPGPHKQNLNKKETFLKSIQIDSGKSGSNSGLNLVVCVLCVVCVSASVYSGWRESLLENRLNILEDKVASMEGKTIKNLDVIVERFRREAENRFKQRVTREVASDRLIFEGLRRTTRDAPECICPAGR